MKPRYLLASIAVVLILAGLTVAQAGAWPTSDYRGHGGCDYYWKNGNQYAMCHVHNHTVGSNVCAGYHQHHYAGWIKTPGGYYSRIRKHDHHVCASPAPHFG